ncbi:MAG TPA: sigma-70 family RNA polymerase sigma factor [Tepidisphaeraceae bacterium]|nr:sigma-70 family RNA polymerase sigma factor [Tepidisphaeraceae bacterium]
MHSTSDDSLLFAAARSRDGDAIAELAHRYVALIYSVAMRITDDPALSQRLTTELMTSVAAGPDRVRGEPAVWIHEQITRRSHETDQARTNAARTDLAEEPHWHEVAPEIDRALLRLNSRYRCVVIQHYCQRHSQDELAAMLQVTQPVVGKRLRKGLDQLRGKLVDAGAGCSLAHLMMLLARHGASTAPPEVLDKARDAAVRHLEFSPTRRSGWLGILTVWAIIAGLVAAVAMSYSRIDDSAEATTTTIPSP